VYPAISRETVRIGSKYYFPDILVDDTNLIIEYYGDYWHANPKFYKSEDVVYHGFTAQNLWDIDKARISALSTKYQVCVLWEDDFKKKKDKILESIDYYLNWGYSSCDDWESLQEYLNFSC
jgi:G:T-mismatch repair DNA endonuclease (very short patch repair protein)